MARTEDTFTRTCRDQSACRCLARSCTGLMQASERSVSLSTLLRPRNLLFFGTFVGQLSLLPYTEWEISAVESAVMLCSWGVKGRMARSTCG